MSLHFISDGAGITNENGESFPVAVDVNPEIFSNEDTQKFFTDALCEEDFILIWVRAVSSSRSIFLLLRVQSCFRCKAI